MDKDFYNKSSADSLSWDPSWFDCEEFDYILVKAIQKWQKSCGLKADGLVGPMTYRRIWTEREASISDHKPSNRTSWNATNSIVHNGSFIPIEWDKLFFGIKEMDSKPIRAAILIILASLIASRLCL